MFTLTRKGDTLTLTQHLEPPRLPAQSWMPEEFTPYVPKPDAWALDPDRTTRREAY